MSGERRTHGEGVEHGCAETTIEACDALFLEDALEQRAHRVTVGRVGLDPGLYSVCGARITACQPGYAFDDSRIKGVDDAVGKDYLFSLQGICYS